MATSGEVERALRNLQILDEVLSVEPRVRELLIEAETLLGRAQGLECTGEPSGWLEDGTVTMWSHDGDTCPVHEWLEESDHGTAHEILRGLRKESP